MIYEIIVIIIRSNLCSLCAIKLWSKSKHWIMASWYNIQTEENKLYLKECERKKKKNKQAVEASAPCTVIFRSFFLVIFLFLSVCLCVCVQDCYNDYIFTKKVFSLFICKTKHSSCRRIRIVVDEFPIELRIIWFESRWRRRWHSQNIFSFIRVWVFRKWLVYRHQK